jgi:adenylylsulfate kinase-like enzyme
MVIWLIGLAGAGKTTLGRALYEQIKLQDPATVFLDGDHVREIMGDDLGHSLEQRRQNGLRITRLCRYLDRQGINVVCAILSLFHEQQRWNRENYSDYFEVFIDVPMDVLIARDQKGLYSGAKAGRILNVAGIDIPFAPPANPDMVLRNDGEMRQIDAMVSATLGRVKPRLKVRQ